MKNINDKLQQLANAIAEIKSVIKYLQEKEMMFDASQMGRVAERQIERYLDEIAQLNKLNYGPAVVITPKVNVAILTSLHKPKQAEIIRPNFNPKTK